MPVLPFHVDLLYGATLTKFLCWTRWDELYSGHKMAILCSNLGCDASFLFQKLEMLKGNIKRITGGAKETSNIMHLMFFYVCLFPWHYFLDYFHVHFFLLC